MRLQAYLYQIRIGKVFSVEFDEWEESVAGAHSGALDDLMWNVINPTQHLDLHAKRRQIRTIFESLELIQVDCILLVVLLLDLWLLIDLGWSEEVLQVPENGSED